MPQPASQSGPVIYTIGHSNHSPEDFVALLRRHEIGMVVDVRSSPYSRYASQFNSDALNAILTRAGIKHVFMGHQLGGRPEGAEFYDRDGYVLYARVASRPIFQEGIAQVLGLAATCRLAMMCGEEDPTECHRRLLLARVLAERGATVKHMRADGRLQTEQELAAEEKSREKDAGQGLLFDFAQVDEWKSTQSVLPKKPPNSSSPR